MKLAPSLLATLLAGWAVGACDGSEGPAAVRRDSVPTGSPLLSGSEDPLRGLGYAGFSEEEADRGRSGVVQRDALRSQPGYDLISLGKRAQAILIDPRGREVRSWNDPDARNWDHCELLEDGDLLVVGSERGERKYAGAVCEDHYLARYAWNGERRWKVAQRAHHDVQVTPRGQILTLTASQRTIRSFDDRHDVVDNQLVLLDLEGKTLEERSLYDLLAAPGSGFELSRPKPNPDPRFPVIDLFHANSIEWMRRAELFGRHPMFAPSVVLLSLRHQDRLVAIDWDSQRVVWQWGRGVLSAPHDARVLADGRILVFDNGLSRGWSRVVEVDPWQGEIVWQYHAPEKKQFFSSGQGSSQRLANGNTLIGNSLAGQAFEVTREGERVWEYLVPFFDERGHRATLYRIRRYEPEVIESFLAR